MAQNQVEIEVVLNSKEAEQGLRRVEKSAEEIGETFSSVGKVVSSTGEKINDGIHKIGETATESTASLTKVKGAAKATGQSLDAMTRPIESMGKAQQSLKKTEISVEGLGKGAEGAGQAFDSMGKVISSRGGEINQSLGRIGETAGQSVAAFAQLGVAAKATGASFTSLLGPIGLAVMAVAELVQSYKEYQLEASGVNMRVEAYKAAAAELTSILEQLADAQVKLNEEQIRSFRIQTMAAQQDLEEAQALREKSAEIFKQIELNKERIRQQQKIVDQAKETAGFVPGPMMGGGGGPAGIMTQSPARSADVEIAELKRLQEEQRKLAKQQADMLARSDKAAMKGAARRQKVQAELEETLKQSPEFQKKIRDTEARLDEDARTARLERTKNTAKAQIEIARIATQRRIREISAIEDISEKVRSNAIAAEREKLEAQITEIQRSAVKKRGTSELDAAKKKAELERQRIAELALERQRQAELRTLRQLELQQMQVDGASAMQILELRYQDEIALAGDNINKMLIAQARFDLEKTKLDQKAEAERIASIQRVTEIHKKNEEERLKATKEATARQVELGKQIIQPLGQAFAEATHGYFLMGESFRESVAESLKALSRQFSVQALGQTAEGIAALFTNPALASSKFTAAGAFATAATAAGAGAHFLGGGGGGGGGGASLPSKSPSGLAQTTTTPERERAETQQTVFNINFSGAVIYDTQRAAEQALADRITNLQNRQRRGGPRRLPNA